jgi:hypothetical protein
MLLGRNSQSNHPSQRWEVGATKLYVGSAARTTIQGIRATTNPGEAIYLTTSVSKGGARMGLLLLIIVIVLVIAVLPTWPYSAGWGYYPGGGLGLILIILLVLIVLGIL